MENSFIIEEWVLEDVLDTLRQVKNYRDEVSTTETALDRSIANSKKLIGKDLTVIDEPYLYE